jgi:predicted nucleic acid-binding Zn ribbon protein
MPVYTYRREDGTTFDLRQNFSDSPLTVDPETGQTVVRVIQNAGVIFKGTGFYINDSKSSKKSLTTPTKSDKGDASTTAPAKAETKSETKSTSQSE